MNRHLYAYPWDIADIGVSRFVDEALALGMNGVALATSYHAGKFLRPHARGARVYFPEDGVVYFEPKGDYGALRPQAHSDAGVNAVLRALLADGRLQVHAWTVLLHNSRMGAAHPEYTARNAFGDGYVYSLCPMQQPVFDYAVALCRDVAAQVVASVIVETPGWLPYAHGYHHEFAQVRSNAWLDAMLGICFCDACVAGAAQRGIDAAGLRKRAAASVAAYLDAPTDASEAQAASWLAQERSDPDFAAYSAMRCERVTELVAAIRAAMPPHIDVGVIPTVQRPTSACWLEGSDLAGLARAADWLEVPFYEPSAAAVDADIAATLAAVGDAGEVRAILRPGPPDLADGAELAQALTCAHAQGIRHFGFYNYGLLRRDRLAALGATLGTFDRRIQ